MTPVAAAGELLIDLDAYTRNLASLTARIAPSALMTVVKSDAYGHGLLPIARAAVTAGIGWIGTLDVPTALRLRDAGIGAECRVFAWLYGPTDDLTAAVAAGIDLGVSSTAELTLVTAAAAATGLPARVHLKLDTGLHRGGALADQWPELVTAAAAAARTGAVEIVGAWTHIAEASEEEDTAAIRRFSDGIATAEALGVRFPLRHVAASAAGYARADSRFDLVRFGAFGYGVAPGGGIGPHQLGLEPVMTLRSRVVGIRDGKAIIPLGSGHGILTRSAGRVSVAIGGRRHPVTRVTIDSLTVDADDSVTAGQPVYLFGNGRHGEPTLQEWADALGTIGEEIVVRLSPTLPRRY